MPKSLSPSVRRQIVELDPVDAESVSVGQFCQAGFRQLVGIFGRIGALDPQYTSVAVVGQAGDAVTGTFAVP